MVFREFLLVIGKLFAQQQTVELRFNEFNQPSISNATIPGLFKSDSGNPSLFDVFLTLERESQIDVGREATYYPTTFTGEISTGANFVLCPDYDPAIFRWNTNQTSASVGIGPRSFLLDTFERISVLRNGSENGVVIFNDSDADHFRTSCYPDTISPISWEQNIGSLPYLSVTYGLMLQARDDQDPISIAVYPGSYPILGRCTGMLNLPLPIADSIYDLIREAGGLIDDDQLLIRNCSRESLIDRLPNLTLTFHGSESSLVLFPDDYITFPSSSNECRLNLQRVAIGASLYFNPLALSHVNVHITRNELFICDSRV